MAAPGKFFQTALGTAYLGDSRDLLTLIGDRSVDLVLTSPPFALKRKKEYGNEDEAGYVDWFMNFAGEFHRILKPSGSLVLDLGGAWLPGRPERSIYQFELLVRLVRETGFRLAQEFYHYNPARLPSPIQWVNRERIRVKDSVNVVWWLSTTERPKANNRAVLRPYSDAMRRLLKGGGNRGKRPSGHVISGNFRDNGGAIPPNLLDLPNTESNSAYQRGCREAGLKIHPARYPEAFADFFIRFLTEKGDLVFDPFAGSNTTGAVAERLSRRWIACELRAEYLEGSRFRFQDRSSTSRTDPVFRTT